MLFCFSAAVSDKETTVDSLACLLFSLGAIKGGGSAVPFCDGLSVYSQRSSERWHNSSFLDSFSGSVYFLTNLWPYYTVQYSC